MESLVYSKTPAGQQELQTRSGKISQKERQLLFMIDGQRSSAMLVAMLPGQEVLLNLKNLHDAGFISRDTPQKPLEEIRFSGPSTIAPPPPRNQQRQIDEARKIILSVCHEFLGQSWEDKLASQLASVRRAEELTPIVEQWAEALRRSGHRGAAFNGEKAIEVLFKATT
ncbi:MULTISPECIES: hypothetical protein [Chitinibacter]|uniref:hypothetical protein n=1 Tax=Chitinibacter TaxID=230666 RepID=UPI000423899D|nr:MULTISPECIES: hypothetical protein [Chitinibacter]